jgi:hypothetical protein
MIVTLVIAGPACAAASAGDKPAVAVVVENPAERNRLPGPATFGMIFARGDMPNAVTVEGLPTQADVKRRWPDGSIKHAVLTVTMPELPAGGRQVLRFIRAAQADSSKAAVPSATDLPDMLIRFAIDRGPAESVSLRRTLQTSKPQRIWLSGPLAVEAHYAAVPANDQGKPDPELEVRFHVTWYPAARCAKVAAVVENCHWTSPGNVPYDVSILVDGQEVYSRKQAGRWEHAKSDTSYLGHPKGARWVKRFWLGKPPGDVVLHYDVGYFNTTGLLPRYDTTVRVPEETLARMAKSWSERGIDILQNGSIEPYFPATGGREDIGPLPTWTARWLLSQDRRAWAIMLGNADLSGGCPIHLRDPATDWVLSIDDHPKFSLNPAGSMVKPPPMRNTAETPYVLPPKSRFSVDAAHQPSLCYLPYLVTGDYYYLEELQFWANHNMINSNAGYRQQDKGILTCAMELRGVAWALRQLVHAAAVSPDEDRGKAYFENKLANNLKYYSDFLAGRLPMRPNPLGYFPTALIHAYGKTEEMRRRWLTMAPWMHNFFTWSFIHAVEHGYTEAAAARDYFMNFSIGAMNSPTEITPYAGNAYYVVLGEKLDKDQTRYFDNWKDVAAGWAKTGAEPPSAPSYPDYGGSYSYIARAVMIEAVRAGRPKAREALQWVESTLPTRAKVLAADPTWAFEPVGN